MGGEERRDGIVVTVVTVGSLHLVSQCDDIISLLRKFCCTLGKLVLLLRELQFLIMCCSDRVSGGHCLETGRNVLLLFPMCLWRS